MADEPYLPVSIEFPIAWGDMDALGHVNNVMYFRYFESARISWFRRVEMPFEPAGPILATTTCDFLLPLTYPDTIRVETGVTKIGNASFTMAYRLFSTRLGAIAARGSGVCVWYDYAAARSAPLPAELRARMEELQRGAEK